MCECEVWRDRDVGMSCDELNVLEGAKANASLCKKDTPRMAEAAADNLILAPGIILWVRSGDTIASGLPPLPDIDSREGRDVRPVEDQTDKYVSGRYPDV